MSKIGIFSDVHANLAAFKAILDALDAEGCDQLLSAGDIVGYGPSPSECLAIVREREIISVIGNHDNYVTLLMDKRLERLSESVRACVEWTQSVLQMDDLRWLAQLPRRLDFEEFSITHGAFGPKRWRYVTNAEAAAGNFRHQDVPLAFGGHTHIPIVSCTSDRTDAETQEALPPELSYLKDGPLPNRAMVLVNVGAVGQPRDHDPRAACVIYDTDTRHLRLLRVPYDISATQQLMLKAGLPKKYAARLEVGR